MRVILLEALGPAFCAGYGLDRSTAAQAADDERRRPEARAWDSAADQHMIGSFASTWAKLHDSGKPTIAAVQGWCIAGGTNIVFNAHLIVSAESARFDDTFCMEQTTRSGRLQRTGRLSCSCRARSADRTRRSRQCRTGSLRSRGRSGDKPSMRHPLVMLGSNDLSDGVMTRQERTMKVLVATNESQGEAPGDYSWTVEGELVTVGSLECCEPDRCGCGRGFAGVASSRATTTAMIVDLPHVGEDDLRTAVYDGLVRDGWVELLDDECEVDDLLDGYLDEIHRTCAAFPSGTILGRQGTLVFDRQRQAAA